MERTVLCALSYWYKTTQCCCVVIVCYIKLVVWIYRAAPATCSAIAPPRLVVPIATTAPTFTPSGAVKTVAPPANPNVLLAQQGSQQKRHSMTALPSSPHRTMAPEQHRHSMEIPSGHEVTMAASARSDSAVVTLAPRTISKVCHLYTECLHT